jgi:hypothetical protein
MLPTDDKNQTEGEENQQTRVVSTKISVDQCHSFNRLAVHLFKNGLIEKPLTSTLLRDCIVNILNEHQVIPNQYSIEKQGSKSDENKQDLSK